MSKARRSRAKEAKKPSDGFYWEQWRDGRRLMAGYHNGTRLDGNDASIDTRRLDMAVPFHALEKLLYK